MSSTIPEGVPPSVGRMLGNHEARIRAIERLGLGRGFIRYDLENVGDWLYVEAATPHALVPGSEFVIGAPQVLFKVDTDNALGAGFSIWAHDGTQGIDPQWSLSSSQMIYYLAGVQDLGYSQGGSIIRYSGGGEILFYTTDSSLPHAGDFQVFTQGTSDDSTQKAGDISLDASNYSGGQGGNIEITSRGTPTGHVMINTGGPNPPNSAGDIGMVATGDINLSSAGDTQISLKLTKSLTVLDHNNNPILRVDEAGSYHIKTGATWTADL